MPIHQHGSRVTLDNRQFPVGQQRRHAELGVAGQHRERRFQFGPVSVLLADQAQQFIADFIAHGIGDDHADLVVLAHKRLNPVLEKLPLFAHGEGLPGRGSVHRGLKAVTQLQQEVVGVEVFDLVGEFTHQ